MVVGNIHVQQANHAARVAMFAIEAVQAANTVAVSEQDPALVSCLSPRDVRSAALFNGTRLTCQSVKSFSELVIHLVCRITTSHCLL